MKYELLYKTINKEGNSILRCLNIECEDVALSDYITFYILNEDKEEEICFAIRKENMIELKRGL